MGALRRSQILGKLCEVVCMRRITCADAVRSLRAMAVVGGCCYTAATQSTSTLALTDDHPRHIAGINAPSNRPTGTVSTAGLVGCVGTGGIAGLRLGSSSFSASGVSTWTSTPDLL
jgi:hypothetical protein